MNYVDIKVTIWNRLKFTDQSDMQQIINLIKNDGIESIADNALGFEESEILFNTEESIQPDQNGGASTIEVYQNGELSWQNDD